VAFQLVDAERVRLQLGMPMKHVEVVVDRVDEGVVHFDRDVRAVERGLTRGVVTADLGARRVLSDGLF